MFSLVARARSRLSDRKQSRREAALKIWGSRLTTTFTGSLQVIWSSPWLPCSLRFIRLSSSERWSSWSPLWRMKASETSIGCSQGTRSMLMWRPLSLTTPQASPSNSTSWGTSLSRIKQLSRIRSYYLSWGLTSRPSFTPTWTHSTTSSTSTWVSIVSSTSSRKPTGTWVCSLKPPTFCYKTWMPSTRRRGSTGRASRRFLWPCSWNRCQRSRLSRRR